MTPVIMIDLDGVLADLFKCLKKFTGDYNLENDRSKLFKSYLPDYVRADGFATQDQMPKAKSLIRYLLSLKDSGTVNLTICTSAGQFYVPVSEVINQKKEWIEKYFPEINDIPFCCTSSGKDKAILAHPNAFLIDDHYNNVDAFIKAGGAGFVYTEDAFSELQVTINNWLRTKDFLNLPTYLQVS